MEKERERERSPCNQHDLIMIKYVRVPNNWKNTGGRSCRTFLLWVDNMFALKINICNIGFLSALKLWSLELMEIMELVFPSLQSWINLNLVCYGSVAVGHLVRIKLCADILVCKISLLSSMLKTKALSKYLFINLNLSITNLLQWDTQ